MNVLESIQQYKQKKEDQKVRFEELPDGDAVILSGRYSGMKLTDILIANSNFVNWLIHDHSIHRALRMIARSIKEDSEVFADGISREIVMKGG
jgi:hypothetical protein